MVRQPPWFDVDVMRAVSRELADRYDDTDYDIPSAELVAVWALQHLVDEAEDRAEDMAICNKVDECTAQAVVLRAVSAWLKGEMKVLSHV